MSMFCPRSSLSVTATIRDPESQLCSARMHLAAKSVHTVAPPVSHNEEIITVHQNVRLQVLLEEMTQRCHASGNSSNLQNLSVMLSPSFGGIQRTVRRLSQFPAHAWLLCLGVFVHRRESGLDSHLRWRSGKGPSLEKRLPGTQH